MVGKPLPNINLNFTQWWRDLVLFSAREPMHNSEKQEATASCRNVLSLHSFLSIFRTTMMMVLSTVLTRNYTRSSPRSIWSASDFKTTGNQVGLKEQREKKINFYLAFLALHGLWQRRGGDFFEKLDGNLIFIIASLKEWWHPHIERSYSLAHGAEPALSRMRGGT